MENEERLGFLIDTNIFLEILLGQERAEEAKIFLSKNDLYSFYMSDYSLHSIGTLLFRNNKYEVFGQFILDMIINGGIHIISLNLEDLDFVIKTAEKFKLDFDDSYQYVISEKFNLTLVSFDKDFDKTDKKRKTP